MSGFLKTQQKYKKIYRELVDGYSIMACEGGEAFVKHISEYDLGALEIYADKHHGDAKKRGLPDEEEKLSILIKNQLWEESKEEKISNLTTSLAALQDSHKKLFLKKQLKQSQEKIDKVSKTLVDLAKEKEDLLGLTCEKYAERKSNEEIVFHCFYKDKNLAEKFFSREEFEKIHHVKLYEYITRYNKISSKFSYLEMQRLAALPFFANLFFMVEDDATKFYGKNITSLSICQVELFNIAKLYKSIINQGNSPPSEFYNDVDKLVSFYDSYSGGDKEVKEAGSKDAQSIVGATMEEMKQMTKGKEGDESVISLQQAFKDVEKEGKKPEDLSMEDIAKMHGY